MDLAPNAVCREGVEPVSGSAWGFVCHVFCPGTLSGRAQFQTHFFPSCLRHRWCLQKCWSGLAGAHCCIVHFIGWSWNLRSFSVIHATTVLPDNEKIVNVNRGPGNVSWSLLITMSYLPRSDFELEHQTASQLLQLSVATPVFMQNRGISWPQRGCIGSIFTRINSFSFEIFSEPSKRSWTWTYVFVLGSHLKNGLQGIRVGEFFCLSILDRQARIQSGDQPTETCPWCCEDKAGRACEASTKLIYIYIYIYWNISAESYTYRHVKYIKRDSWLLFDLILLSHVRRFTMPKYITHEALGADLFNGKHHTASGALQPWQRYLSNSTELLLLLVARMERDWSSSAPKMRKAWTAKDVDPSQTLVVAQQVFIFDQKSEIGIPQIAGVQKN